MKSSRAFNFNSIPVPKVGSTMFNLSHSVTGALPLGKAVPLVCAETVPGDTWYVGSYMHQRLLALIAPMYSEEQVHIDWFFVPKRLVYKDFEAFRTGGEDGTAAPSLPLIDIGEFGQNNPDIFRPGSLFNYFGLPAALKLENGVWKFDQEAVENTSITEYIDLSPINAYHLIWNEWYRDQTLQDKKPIFDESKLYTFQELYDAYDEAGYDFEYFYDCFSRAWKKDYYTSALPDPQRGQAVGVPFAQSAQMSIQDPRVKSEGDDTSPTGTVVADGVTGSSSLLYAGQDVIKSIIGTANLQYLSTVSVIGLRTSFAIQRVLEKFNITGSRLKEFVLGFFNEYIPDNTLQRPLRLSSSFLPMQVSEVETNAETGGLVVGDLAGKSKGAGKFRPFKLHTVEDGYLMALVTIMPDPVYAGQGIPKMFQRFTRWDMFIPETQFIGEQAIKNKELYLDWKGNGAQDWNNADFGYQGRFTELKFMPNRIVGDMQTSLAYWHQARMFSGRPGLNSSFIECHPSDRVFAVQDSESAQKAVGQFWFDIQCKRKMARYAQPRLV